MPDSWPYPHWVAHRGAGKLAPENTLAAFRLGASHGWRMFECDVKLSADGVPFLLHDDTLERTTDGQGVAGARRWAELSRLDAGAWHSRAYAGEPLPTLQALGRWIRANGLLLNVEIKPTKGTDAETGAAVAQACALQWAGAPVPPLLTSFRPDALAAAGQAAPALPRGLLLHELWDGWFEAARRLGCRALVLNHRLLDGALVARAREAGWRTAVYTPNEPEDIQRVQDAGVDMVITDAVDRFVPDR